VAVRDPGGGWAERLWEAVVTHSEWREAPQRFLDTLPEHLQLELVRVSGGRVRPTWAGAGR